MTPMLEKVAKAIVAEETRQLTDGRKSNELRVVSQFEI